MPFEMLHPAWDAHLDSYKPQQVGAFIRRYEKDWHTETIASFDIALISVGNEPFHASFRKDFYRLFIGNWNKKIVDLGQILPSPQQQDTHFIVKELCRELLKNNVLPLVVAESQSLVEALYSAFEPLEQLVNMVAIDALLDLGSPTEFIDPNSYMTRILSREPSFLYRFTNIGYQSYYVSQEELDFLRKMTFDAHRLGEFINAISEAEPLLRNADLIHLDMSCVQAKDLDFAAGFPNGFSAREICQIARYIGLSPQNKCVGIFQTPQTALSHALLSQILWYIIEGFHFRVEEIPSEHNTDFVKYIVPIDTYEIEFFKSLITHRWWIRPYVKDQQEFTQTTMLPCSPNHYKEATQGKIPDIWWNAYRL